MWTLAGMFLIVALLYASVGFGGGSTYTALLAASKTDYRILPTVALSCNIVVVIGGVWRFGRIGAIPWRRAAPLCAVSAPLAWLGGRMPISEPVFIGLLGSALALAGVATILLPPETSSSSPLCEVRPVHSSVRETSMGAGIGFLSGIVGIGGGIFLAPLLHLSRWASSRSIAGTASVFILVNSVAGLAGQLTKLSQKPEAMGSALAFLPLILAAIIGGQVGSRLGADVLPQDLLRMTTGLLVLAVAVRLLFRFAELAGRPV